MGGFTRPLERVLDEFLKFYITLQVTATLATQARIKYTEACIDSPVLSAWKCCDSVSQPLTVRNNRVNPRLCRKIKRNKWKKSIRVDSSRNRRSFLRFSADLSFLEKCYIMLHRISLTLKYKNEYIYIIFKILLHLKWFSFEELARVLDKFEINISKWYWINWWKYLEWISETSNEISKNYSTTEWTINNDKTLRSNLGKKLEMEILLMKL